MSLPLGRFFDYLKSWEATRLLSISKRQKGNNMSHCKSIGCPNPASPHQDFCSECHDQAFANVSVPLHNHKQSLSEKYPNYYKPVGELTEIDVYAVHHLFNIQDASGCIHHASKKLLLSGMRTGGKSAYEDIKEASDTLKRWLQLNEDNQ